MKQVIQKNWQELIKPEKLQVNPGHDPKRFATVVAEHRPASGEDEVLTAVALAVSFDEPSWLRKAS